MSPRAHVFKMFVLLTVIVSFAFSGCTVIFQKGRRTDVEHISKLKSELTDLEKAKAELERRLHTEIGDNQVKVEMQDKGLVITFVAEVLFDSGKAKLREESLSKLAKVGRVLETVVPDRFIGVEGHTDNVPIQKSGWKSNWELSAARAMSVLHYLVEKNVDPKRLSATGYGEYRPVATNDSAQGRQRNRRVEIVIMPALEKKVAQQQ